MALQQCNNNKRQWRMYARRNGAVPRRRGVEEAITLLYREIDSAAWGEE